MFTINNVYILVQKHCIWQGWYKEKQVYFKSFISKMVNWFFEFDSKGDYIYEVDIAGGWEKCVMPCGLDCTWLFN